jgi:phosphoenolpyruvate phosphomutase
MKALILNSGIGKRMGQYTKDQPKCMIKIGEKETILSRQLKQLHQSGINQIIMTTGPFHDLLINYCKALNIPIQYTFINNLIYDQTNYIYSIYLAKDYLSDDIVMLHGDLVFETNILQQLLKQNNSTMTVSTTLQLPDKDFKAVIENDTIKKIGIEYFQNALAAQPLYKLNKPDWMNWLNQIIKYCIAGNVTCYAENAFNEIADDCRIYPLDVKNKLCGEIDTPEDLEIIKEKLLKEVK